jgi:hypothetical protein
MNKERRQEIKESLFEDALDGIKTRIHKKINQGLAEAAELEVDLLQLYIEETTWNAELVKSIIEKHTKITAEILRNMANYERVLRNEEDEKNFLNENLVKNYFGLVNAIGFIDGLESPQITVVN